MTRRAAIKAGINPDIFERQIQQESGFNPTISSKAGASGIAQIMPATAKAWGVDPLTPEQALFAAATHMGQYVRKYGSYENALRAYNAGPGAIEASKGYAETNKYVSTIMGGTTPTTSGAGGATAKGTGTGGSGTPSVTPSVSMPTSGFDQAGFDKAQNDALLYQLFQGSGATTKNIAVFALGARSPNGPDRSDFVTSGTVQ